jgi:cytochrome c-type biogenesis protein
VDLQTLSFALAAGTFAAVNPCGFAMLPAYLTLVVLGDGRQHPRRVVAVGRALAATAVMALGFVAVFGAFGLVIAPLADSVQRYLPIVTVLIGAVLIALGAGMLTGRELTVLLPKPRRGAPTARLGSMFGYGVAYAIASLSCTIGPFLAVTSATFRAGSVLGGVLAYLAYAAGMALVVGVAASAAALAGTAAITAARRLLRYVNRAGGALLILVGAYVGYYGVYEFRLVFFAQTNPQDPVIEAAAAIQQTLAGWLSDVGVRSLIVMLAVLVLGAVLLGKRLTRGSRFPRQPG